MKTVFVFASNLAGRHGAGSALEAKLKWGAEEGVNVGPTGNAYAIPTKDERFNPLPLPQIKVFVQRFLRYAAGHSDTKFKVVAIGCGLRKLMPAQVAPMFAGATSNVQLPKEFADWLYNQRKLQSIARGAKHAHSA